MPNDKSGFDQGEFDRPAAKEKPKRPLEYVEVPHGSHASECRAKSCRTTIFWVERESTSKKTPGKIVKVPVDCDYDEQCRRPTTDGEDGIGVNHFQTCASAGQF